MFFIVLGLQITASGVLWAATGPTESDFKSCTKNSLKLNSPNERDQARLGCLEKKLPQTSTLSSCLKEAKKFEYLLTEQEAIKTCYHSNSKFWGIKNCLTVAKELHSLSDRDGMRLDCVATLGVPNDKGQCLNFANSFEQIEYKRKFNSTCLEN